MTPVFSFYGTVPLAVTTTTARAVLPLTALSDLSGQGVPNSGTRRIRVARVVVPLGTLVAATDIVHITFGSVTVVATALTGATMFGGSVAFFEVPIEATHVAAISSANGATIVVNIGNVRK